MSLFMHRAETNLNIDWFVTNSIVDGNDGNDTIRLLGPREDFTIGEPSFDDNDVRSQVITSNLSGSTVTINDVENAVFHGPSIVTETLVSAGIDLSEFNVIETGDGDDVVLGGLGSDYVDTQGGADRIFTGAGEDYIKISGDSGGGQVIVDAGSGSDSFVIDGFTGSAELISGSGQDTLTIIGGYDDLVMSNTDLVLDIGGSSIVIKEQLVDDGTGNLVFNENGGIGLITSIVEDESGQLIETSVALDPTQEGDLGLILLTDGDDQYITPFDSPNDFQISGFAGNDLIIGGSNDDVIYGGEGDDILAGSDGDDQIYGGSGSDILEGGFGTDTLIGGSDSDVYILEIAATDGLEDVIDETQGEADRLFVIGTNTEGIYGQMQSDGSLYLDFETVFTYDEPDFINDPNYTDDPDSIIHPNYTDDPDSIIHPNYTDDPDSVIHPNFTEDPDSVIHPNFADDPDIPDDGFDEIHEEHGGDEHYHEEHDGRGGYAYQSAAVMIEGFSSSNSQDSVEQIILIDDQYSTEILDRLNSLDDEFRTPNFPPIDDYSGRLVVNVDTDTHFWAEHGSEAMEYLSLPEYKDFIQINKSDEIIEVNLGPPYNKKLLNIPNFEVVELKTSLDDGFIEFITSDDPSLEINIDSILDYGDPLERFGNLDGWANIPSLNKAFSVEDTGDSILLKLTSPSSERFLVFLISIKINL